MPQHDIVPLPVAPPPQGEPAGEPELEEEVPHVHFVTLPDGTEVTTGPAVTEAELAGEGAAPPGGATPGAPAGGVLAPAPGALRAPGLNPKHTAAILEAAIRLKAEKGGTFDECVESVMADPAFDPEGEPEESARAICASKPGGPAEGGKRRKVRTIPVPDPGTESARDTMSARAALQTRNPRLLPEEGKAIFERMRGSALRGKSGDSATRYANELAWRAIRQKYDLLTPTEVEEERYRALALGLKEPSNAEEASSAQAGAQAQEGQAAEEAAQGPKRLRKAYVPAVGEPRGANIVVRTVYGSTQAAKYERKETVGIPGWPGVAVQVGFAAGGFRQPLEVWMPKSMFAGEMPQIDGVRWVRDHTFAIWQAARNLIAPHLKHAGGPGAEFRWSRSSKLYLTPERATERISFAEAYVPFEVDLQGQYATESEVERMAHGFLVGQGKIGEMHGRWTMPDGEPPGRVVESFLARWPNPYFTKGAWVLGVRWHPQVWDRIVRGEYKGLSIGGKWGAAPIRVAAVLEPAARRAA